MARIAVFDSGFGSLSIISAIQKVTKSEIIYFADQKNFPYGKKSKKSLEKIIIKNLELLKEKFHPDLIVLGSNTPSLLLHHLNYPSIIFVVPPLKEASRITNSSSIAILATKTVFDSNELRKFIQKKKLPKKIKILKINASPLVELVELGNFITNPSMCRKRIKKILGNIFEKNNVDVVTLSSTHLPFLLEFLQEEYPNVKFIDPAKQVAKKVSKIISNNKSNRNTMKVFTSSNPALFQKHLQKLGIKNKVRLLASV